MVTIATELGVAYVSITASLRNFRAPIAKELTAVERSGAQSGKALGQKMGGSFASSLKRAVGPALAVFGAGAIAGFAKQAVGAFSELEDSTAAAGVVFGDNMKQIITQSKTAAKSMGLTQQQVINAANTFGTYGKAAGLSGKALADFATEQTQLAADMASFKGTSPEQAIEAIGSALRGEMEPIRAYGVLLDDASLRQQALAMGLISTTKDALSPQNKTLAAQALILKQTADAQGDFARTSDSTANVAKTLSATTSDVSAKLGSVLAPAFTSARIAALGAVEGVSGILDKVLAFQGALSAGALTPDLVKAIGLDPKQGFGAVVGEGIGSIRAFGNAWKANDGDITSGGLAGYMENLAFKLRGFLDTVSTVSADLWAKLGPALVELGPPVLDLLAAISPLGIVLKALGPVLPDLADAAGELAAVVAGVLTVAVEQLTPIISGVVSAVADFFSNLTSTQAGVDGLMGALAIAGGIFVAYKVGVIASTVATKAHTVATNAAAVAQKALNLVMKANPIGIIITLISGLVAGLVWFFTQTETGKAIIANVWAAIQHTFKVVTMWIQSRLLWLQAMWHLVWTTIKRTASDIWNNITSAISGAINYVVKWVQSKILELQVRWHYIWTTIKNTVRDTWDGINSTVSNAWSKLKGTFNTLIDFVKTAIPNAFEKAKDGIGKAWNAIKEIAKKPVKFVIEQVINDGLIGTFNKIPGVNIPKIKLPRGFRKGGYTGDGRADEAAGIVHKGEYVVTKEETRRLGGAAAVRNMIDSGPSVPGAFMGNRNAIAQHGAYYLKTAAGMGPWNFPGAARMWDGAAGVRVRMGTGRHQGYVSAAERGGGILGYTTGTNIDMSPSWMARLGATQRRTVAAHEIGHALGLPHMGGNSIMAAALGNMASVPTSQDVRMLQRLYPGGSGKAGSGAPENPFAGMVGTLMEAFKKAFPGAGMFVDAAGGLAKSGIESVIKFVSDIAGNVGRIVGDITGGVVDGIRNFFGGGTAQAALYDTGGWLMPNGGRPQLVQNKTGEPELILTGDQRRNMQGGGGVTINGNVGWDPDEVARQIEVRKRRAETVAGLGGVVFA